LKIKDCLINLVILKIAMRKIDELLMEYGEGHKHRTNKVIHWICVPLIFFSVVGLIASIPFPEVHSWNANAFVNWASAVLFLAMLYYISLSISLSIRMLVFAVSCLDLAAIISESNLAPFWLVSLLVFVISLAGQFYGHKIEGKKPSFFKDIQFLLIGPAWLLHFFYHRSGIRY
jgi:uncharacterized membrane protein YGL010W